ncbi:MAG TPA: hypothetical protein VFE62_18065 [Gemmataceae bacterium]|nr:hypothetical protein [Gemmataceae bacterium]
MSIPTLPNATCDIYRDGNTPPASPDVASVACFLRPDFVRGRDRQASEVSWTHTMLVDVSVDIRDGYSGQSTGTTQDSVYVPDKTGTKFNVIFCERALRGTPHEHLVVYLDRPQPTWPTSQL